MTATSVLAKFGDRLPVEITEQLNDDGSGNHLLRVKRQKNWP